MVKKLFLYTIIFSVSFMLSGCADKYHTEDTGKPENIDTVQIVMFDDSQPKDEALVENAVSKITREKIQANVDIETIVYTGYTSEYNLLLSENPKIDLICMLPGSDVMKSLVSMDLLQPLEELLDFYGQDIENTLGGSLKSGEYRQHQYSIPSIRQSGHMDGVILLREMIDKYNIDVSRLKSWQDLDDIFAIIHENEPQLTVLAPVRRDWGLASYMVNTDNLGGRNSGVLLNGGLDDLKVVNYFESEEYKQAVYKVREWYTKGYIDQDVLFQQESHRNLMSQGQVFSYFNLITMDDNQEHHSIPKISVPLMDCVATTDTSQQVLWGIPSASANPQKAMQFLNLMYSDKEIVNLLQYGIEGVHYTIQENGTMLHEMDATEKSGYFRKYTQSGNLDLLITSQVLGPDFSQKKQALEDETKYSKAYGFVFDTTALETELSAIQAVLDIYQLPLELGTVDPDTELPIMLEKLREAGIDQVIAEKQRQLNHWASLQKKSKKVQKR